MAKMITRTIKIYTYTTGNFDMQTMRAYNIQNHSFPFKLGQRARRELEKANGNILSESVGEALYGMTIDEFMQHAKPVTKEEADENGLSEVPD